MNNAALVVVLVDDKLMITIMKMITIMMLMMVMTWPMYLERWLSTQSLSKVASQLRPFKVFNNDPCDEMILMKKTWTRS